MSRAGFTTQIASSVSVPMGAMTRRLTPGSGTALPQAAFRLSYSLEDRQDRLMWPDSPGQALFPG